MPENGFKIFVAGEHGQVAQALGTLGPELGYAMRLCGRAGAGLENRAAISAVITDFRPDLIINAAAYTAVDKAESEPAQAFLLNRDGAANIAAAAAAVRAPLIHISTDYVFDGRKPSPYLETDTPHPMGVYGASKLGGEIAIAAAGIDHVILRTGWVCSPIGNNFVKTMLRLAGQREEIGVVDDQHGAPTFAADLARAIFSIADRLLRGSDRSALNGIYNATGSGEATWCGFAREIMKASAERGGPSCRVRAITTEEYPTAAKRPENSRLDCAKLARLFGIRLPQWENSLGICLNQLILSPHRVST